MSQGTSAIPRSPDVGLGFKANKIDHQLPRPLATSFNVQVQVSQIRERSTWEALMSAGPTLSNPRPVLSLILRVVETI